MTTINNINDLLHMLSDVLSDEYTEEVTNGECLDDTIKVTKQGSTSAMYLSLDENYPSVIVAAVYDEPDGYHMRGEFPMIDGIYFDTEDNKLKPEIIAEDIEKYL